MTVQLLGLPRLTLSYSDPNLTANDIGVQSAQWDGSATVRVADEQGKRWRIGFVQVLHKNVMTAVYAKHRKTEVLLAGKALPILDGPKNPLSRPFYDKNAPEVQEVLMPAHAPPGTVQDVNISMWDEPESHYDWWHNNDATDPLREFVMYLTFSTYIVAFDKTTNTLSLANLRFLKQWDVVLDRRYEFNVVRAAGPGLTADLTRTTWKVDNPQRTPFVTSVAEIQKPSIGVLTGEVANQVFTDDVVAAQGVHVGVGVRALAANFGAVGHYRRP